MIPFDFLGAENDLFVAPLKSPMAFDFTIILPHIEGLKARGGSTTLWRLYAHKKKCLPAQFVFFLGLLGTHTRDTPKPKPPHLPHPPTPVDINGFRFYMGSWICLQTLRSAEPWHPKEAESGVHPSYSSPQFC